MNTNSHKKTVIARGFLFLLVLITASFAAEMLITAKAADSKILLTWSAESYAPANFTGKILPTENSTVAASLEIISDGKPVNLSKETIYWYLDNKSIGGGTGEQNIAFTISDFSPSSVELMAQIPEYTGGLLIKRVRIPVARPEIVIKNPYQNNEFRGTVVQLSASPYFFGITGLSDAEYSWTINGQVAEGEKGEKLVIETNPDARSGAVLNVGARIRNNKNASESASKNISLKFMR